MLVVPGGGRAEGEARHLNGDQGAERTSAFSRPTGWMVVSEDLVWRKDDHLNFGYVTCSGLWSRQLSKFVNTHLFAYFLFSP